MSPLDVLLLHVAATWALVGLIWVVQLVQYPGFELVRGGGLIAFHEHHCARVAWVVGPLMGVELLTGIALWWERPVGLSDASLAASLVLLAVNWVWTGAVAVPLHARIGARAETPESRAERKLVAANWVRTLAWTGRGLWGLFVVRAVFAAAGA